MKDPKILKLWYLWPIPFMPLIVYSMVTTGRLLHGLALIGACMGLVFYGFVIHGVVKLIREENEQEESKP